MERSISRPRTHRSFEPFGVVAAWFAVLRQRQALAHLDAARLNDIGVTADEARAEADRPFWDVPSHWIR